MAFSRLDCFFSRVWFVVADKVTRLLREILSVRALFFFGKIQN